ncbi:unnamed protein product, partial [Urochloa humidicola]
LSSGPPHHAPSPSTALSSPPPAITLPRALLPAASPNEILRRTDRVDLAAGPAATRAGPSPLPAATLSARLRAPPSSSSPPPPRRHGSRHRLNSGSCVGSAVAEQCVDRVDLCGLPQCSASCSCDDLADGGAGRVASRGAAPDGKQRSDTVQESGGGHSRRWYSSLAPGRHAVVACIMAWCLRWLLQWQRPGGDGGQRGREQQRIECWICQDDQQGRRTPWTASVLAPQVGYNKKKAVVQSS